MKVIIKTPARLHLGLIDLNGDLGRLYGSIGVAIDRPNVVIEASPATELKASGKDAVRVKRCAAKFSDYYHISPMAHINVKETITEHNGLGSGTQLSLAVGEALCELHDIKAPVSQIASVMRRGFISGIGVASYQSGGFTLDCGFNTLTKAKAQPLFQGPFPEGWVFVLAVPQLRKGLAGTMEQNAFREIIPGPKKNAEEISRLVVMKLLPSLLEKDIRTFGEAATEVDRKTSDYYKKLPRDKTLAKVVARMLHEGAYGAGQSSWGPAVYGLTEEAEAETLAKAMATYLDGSGIEGSVYVARPDNRGREKIIL